MPNYLAEEMTFVGKIHHYNTKQRNNTDEKFRKTSAGQKCVTYTVFEMYNKLPYKVKEPRIQKENGQICKRGVYTRDHVWRKNCRVSISM